MAQSPWKQGDREPYWTFGLQPDSESLDVTGLVTSDFTLVFIDGSTTVESDGDGVFTNITAAIAATSTTSAIPATITYQPGPLDVATVRTCDRRVVIHKGTVHQKTFEFGPWVCER